MDEFIREVADWVHDKIGQALKQGYQGVIEVEAKLGVLKYKDADTRMQAPVRVETSELGSLMLMGGLLNGVSFCISSRRGRRS